MVPLQAFQPPLLTAPSSAVMCRVTVFLALTDPHLVMLAWVLPAYPAPELVKVSVNEWAMKPGAASSASVVRVHRLAVQADEKRWACGVPQESGERVRAKVSAVLGHEVTSPTAIFSFSENR